MKKKDLYVLLGCSVLIFSYGFIHAYKNLKNKKNTEEIVLSQKNEKKDEDNVFVKDEMNDVFFSNYFQKNVLEKYKHSIDIYLQNEGDNSLRYIKEYIFNDNGDFDYNGLRRALKENYINMKNITSSEILFPALMVFPLDRYLSEIDLLEETEDIDFKVEGILSYWASINISLSAKNII